MSTLHILSSPYNPVHIKNRIDAFAVAVVKFIDNMQKLGWNCIHYGIKGCEVNCETVICLNEAYSDKHDAIKKYNEIAGIEIAKRKKPNDMIMCFHGWENRDAAQANSELPIVEPYIAYDHTAVFAPYKVFVSYATMHMYYGHKGMLMSPSWYDAVISNGFDPNEFEYNENKKNYILYFGRIIESKGIHLAIQATQHAGRQLIIAGPGTLADLGYREIPSHVTCVGLCDADQRKVLMKDAAAIIGPTYYVEPFGNMVVEGYLSGTPAITTDWGGFTETVINGITGYRCRDFKEFVHALNNIDKIKSEDCRQWAIENYSESIVYPKLSEYFKKILAKDFYRL
jgi:glycosyltransferase involved in cell wall biosynthesis